VCLHQRLADGQTQAGSVSTNARDGLRKGLEQQRLLLQRDACPVVFNGEADQLCDTSTADGAAAGADAIRPSTQGHGERIEGRWRHSAAHRGRVGTV
jgi:hypothetical protein